MKKLFLTFLFGLIAIGISAQAKHFPTMFAHRGCWTMNEEKEFVIPENSVAAVTMAKKMGYTGIECDVHYTKDKVMVILHDNTLNRTTRLAKDYSPLKEPVKLSDVTFEELRNNYVLASTNPELRTPVPTLKELLDECKKVWPYGKGKSVRDGYKDVYTHKLESIHGADIHFWYGTKEAFVAKPQAKHLCEIHPDTHVEVFPGMNHGQLLVDHPEDVAKRILGMV